MKILTRDRLELVTVPPGWANLNQQIISIDNPNELNFKISILTLEMLVNEIKFHFHHPTITAESINHHTTKTPKFIQPATLSL